MNYTYENKQMLEELDKSIELVVRNLDKSLIIHFKNYLEKNFFNIVGEEIELRIIVDANAIISETLSYIKKGESFLLKISESPFLKLYAPKWLLQEIKNKIPELSKKKKIQQDKLSAAFTTIIAKIQFLNVADEGALLLANQKIGHKDPKDIPYAALYFSSKTHGVLTKDKHFQEVPEIKVWEKSGHVGKIVTLFETGSFVFFITAKGMPPVFKLLYAIGVVVLRFILEIVQKVINAIVIFANGAVKELAKLPDWIKLILIVVLILRDDIRDTIINAVNLFLKSVHNFLSWIYRSFKNFLEILAPFVKIAIEILAFLFEKITTTINTVNEINIDTITKNATYASDNQEL